MDVSPLRHFGRCRETPHRAHRELGLALVYQQSALIEAFVIANGGGKMAECGRAVVGGTGAAEERGL